MAGRDSDIENAALVLLTETEMQWILGMGALQLVVRATEDPGFLKAMRQLHASIDFDNFLSRIRLTLDCPSLYSGSTMN